MNESGSLRAFEDVTECHGSELHGRSVVLLHFVPWVSFVNNATPIVGRPKFHRLASFTEYNFFENLAAAILHVSGKRIDADPSPALLLKRFCIRNVGAISDPTSRKNPFFTPGKTASDTHLS